MLEHLLSDELMKRQFGPQSEVGDKSIYLAEMPRITIQTGGPNVGKVSLNIRYFGNNLLSAEKFSEYYYTSHELKMAARRKNNNLPEKPNRVTFKDTEQFFTKVFKLNEHREFNNVIFCGGEPLLWQLEVAKAIRLSSEQFDQRSLTYEIETNGTMPVEPEISDWIKRSHINIRPNLEVVKGFPLVAQLTNHRSSRQKGVEWTHFEHKSWVVIFDYNDNIEQIDEFVERYKLSKDKIFLESKENPLECISVCIQNGYRHSPSLELL
jgi:organic radical activating enzyme